MIPSRKQQIYALKRDTFDLLVIGGGATGTGIALDAATRGLRVALVEAHDFASGTSSRSTKLFHGGLRYLEKAVKNFDRTQFSVVYEALHERQILLNLAPHLTRPLPMIIPLYRWIDLFYIWPGVKLYDLMSGGRKLGESGYVSAEEVKIKIPHLKQSGLKGGIVLYDGQFDDSRMNLSLALTAVSHGAAVANYVECLELIKKDGKITGAIVQDRLTKERWEVSSKYTVNATGPLADRIRKMDDPNVTPAIRPSIGTHLLLDPCYTPKKTGLLIPKTSDERLLFLLPWEGKTLVGTTDIPMDATETPKPSVEEIDYLLKHLNETLDTSLAKSDIKASWAGLRPLLDRPEIASTQKLPRDYQIEISPSGLYSIMGGKWTSYRKMAEDLLAALPFDCGKSKTEQTILIGGRHYSPELWKTLPVDEDIAKHLAHAYGDRAEKVLKCGSTERLAEGYPYIHAEILWAIQQEYACSPEDILERRMHLAFLDENASHKALSIVKKYFSD